LYWHSTLHKLRILRSALNLSSVAPLKTVCILINGPHQKDTALNIIKCMI
jgi:hypothetical protein